LHRAAWEAHLLRAEDQALDDLARARTAEVVFVRHPRLEKVDGFLDDLEERANVAGFVTATVGVANEAAFDELHGLVAGALRSLRAPNAFRAKRGLIALLDAFVARRPKPEALADFDARTDAEHAAGDLVTLARSYVAAHTASRIEAKRIEAWLSGVELARADPSAPALLALGPRTAKRALGDLTRLVRALGWRGTVIVFREADVVSRLSPARREAAYTVLRELVDNADGGRGLVAAQLVLSASTSFFTGTRSVGSLRPLETRIAAVHDDAGAPPPPHRPILDLLVPEGFRRTEPRALRPAADDAAPALRVIIRASQGLPPIEATPAMSVGHDRIDRSIDALFEHSDMDGSVFALLTGEYGAGKTHFLLHLAARALAQGRPVFRLSLERLDADLGHPERHVVRLLEHALLPPDGRTGALDRLARWTRRELPALVAALEQIAAGDGEAALAAHRALTRTRGAARADLALEAYLGATELASKSPGPATRREAYARVLLWLALLERLEGCAGPILLIDEAENLYRGGATRAERRTALRSLSFYCGGALPRACVVLAITPDTLSELQREAPDLLDDVAEQRSLLAVEDASMLCHRLKRTRPIAVPALTAPQRTQLAELVRSAHESARGAVDDPGFDAFARRFNERASPREVVRATVSRLEHRFWNATDGEPRPRARHLGARDHRAK
jgi:hypothetical protein